MKCLVTGHKGFIGKNLMNHLRDMDNVITIEKDFIKNPEWEIKLMEYVED